MSVSLSKDPSALAKELNQFVTDSGGQPIAGLDQLDPKQLISIRDGLKQFLDNFDQAKAQDPALAGIADGEAVKSLRQLAQIASAGVDRQALGNASGQSLFGPSFDPMAMNAVNNTAFNNIN